MRTDSTHVLSAVRELNRLEFVGETLRHALNLLATIDPEWLQSWVPTEWFDRYKRQFEEYRLPSSREKRYELGEQIGRDGMALWERLAETPTLKLLRNLPALEVFRLVWLQQYQWEEGKLCWRQKGNLPPAAQMISTPYDKEARYSTKRQISWVGYKVHLTEICDDESPHLIVNVETDIATASDYDATPIIHNHLKERDLLPAEHLVDAGYPSSDHLVSSQEHGIDLVGPVSSDPSWQARTNGGHDAASFTIDWEKQLAICPQGQTSNRWMSFQQNNQMMFNFRFPRGACLTCEVRSKCTKSATHARALLLQPQPAYEALHAARQHQKTDEFKQRYAKRAGIEGTISQGVAIGGLRQARYIGLAKTHLQHLMTAIGINLHRLGDWWAEQTRAQTRISPFASLALT
jgi:transposase